MTNQEAFNSYYQDDVRAELVLTSNDINPTLSDNLELSSAFGMRELSLDPNYKQGKTSQSLDKTARSVLSERANEIFKKYGVSSDDGPIITSMRW